MSASSAVLMLQKRVERKSLHIGDAEEGKGRDSHHQFPIGTSGIEAEA
jgi:hypothetical protein